MLQLFNILYKMHLNKYFNFSDSSAFKNVFFPKILKQLCDSLRKTSFWYVKEEFFLMLALSITMKQHCQERVDLSWIYFSKDVSSFLYHHVIYSSSIHISLTFSLDDHHSGIFVWKKNHLCFMLETAVCRPALPVT